MAQQAVGHEIKDDSWSAEKVLDKILGKNNIHRDNWYLDLFDIKVENKQGTGYYHKFEELLKIMYEPLARDLKTVFKQIQDQKLRDSEIEELEKFYDTYHWFTQKWKKQDFVEASQLYSTGGSDIQKARADGKTQTEYLHLLCLAIRIGSRISKQNSIRENVMYIQALVLLLGLMLERREDTVLPNVDEKDIDNSLSQEVFVYAMRPDMFPWFEQALNSWGLNITPEGLTSQVEILPGHERKNEFTTQNLELWKEFSLEQYKEHVVTLGMLTCFAHYARTHDLSKTQTEEWGAWNLADDLYLLFVNSPSLKKHDNYKQVLEYVQESRSVLNKWKTSKKGKRKLKSWRRWIKTKKDLIV